MIDRRKKLKRVTVGILVAILVALACYGELHYLLLDEPLSQACMSGDEDRVRGLLRWGADPNGSFDDIETCLTAAVRGDHVGIAQILLDHGADVNQRTDGHTPLDDARSSEMKALLRSHDGRFSKDVQLVGSAKSTDHRE